MQSIDIDQVVRDRRLNAGLSWVLIGAFLVVAVEGLVTGDLLWAAFASGAMVIALLPAGLYRSPAVMPHWEVLLLAALPVLGRALATNPLSNNVTMYLSVAALALLIAVELHVFTPVKMSVSFAVVFVVVATMAASGVWAVTRWVLDIQFGTGFIESERALMIEFVSSTAAGVGGGFVFEYYFRRFERLERLPDSVAEELAEELSEIESRMEESL